MSEIWHYVFSRSKAERNLSYPGISNSSAPYSFRLFLFGKTAIFDFVT